MKNSEIEGKILFIELLKKIYLRDKNQGKDKKRL
jgi:hypothetical protein